MTLSLCPACRTGLARCTVCGGAESVWTLDAAELRAAWLATYASAFPLHLSRLAHGTQGVDGMIDATGNADRYAREDADAAVRMLRERPMPTCERSETT